MGMRRKYEMRNKLSILTLYKSDARKKKKKKTGFWERDFICEKIADQLRRATWLVELLKKKKIIIL